MAEEITPNPQAKKKRKAPVITDTKFVGHGGAARSELGTRGYNVRVNLISAGSPTVLEYHLDDGTTTASGMPFSEFVKPAAQWMVVRTPSSNWIGSQGWHFAAVEQHVLALSELDEEDPERVEPELAERAKGVLAMIESGSKASAPHVFAHGGDAVVLTWEGEIVVKLLTVSNNSVRLLAIQRQTKERQTVTIDMSKSDDRLLLMQTLGGLPSVSSLVDDDR